MIDDIKYFLPIYSDIDDPNFNMSIYRKKEFYDEKLSKFEAYPSNPGELLKAQKIISRFLSSYTIYNSLLLRWELGSGKTGAAIGAIEKIKNEGSIYDKAIILAKGDTLIENFKNEIVFKSTPGQYIPENYKLLTRRQKKARIKKNLSVYYDFWTFEKFVKKEIMNKNDEYLIETYSNKIIVIDEVHNIRLHDKIIKNKKEGVLLYDNFHRFLHTVKNCKILLLSGTPIKDTIDEIADIFNLILPMDKQLPIGKVFLKEYFNNEDKLYTIKPEKIKEIKEYFKGYVSFLESTKSEVKKKYEGETIGKLKHFKVYPDIMGEFQTNIYEKAYIKDKKRRIVINEEEEGEEYDTEEDDEYYEYISEEDGAGNIDEEEEKSGFSKSCRQASLFVFPDGTYGKQGFNNPKYIKIKTTKEINVTAQKTDIDKEEKVQIKKSFSLGEELKNALKGKDNDERLKKLEIYSSKYASVIRNILEGHKTGKSCFIYSEFVKGSGGILFSLILNLFGFKKYSGKENPDAKLSKEKRYAVINNETVNSQEIQNIIERFNRPDNMHGEYINVIIGSIVIAEGVSFKNVQEEHILTPFWNYSIISQAIGRGYRFGSHNDLISAGITPDFRIYQYVSIPNNPELESIDLRLYEISEIKDMNIKGVEQLMKESAFDCALNFDRNHIEGYDNKRECNYTLCNYKCDDIIMDTKEPFEPIKINKLDISSYEVYYNKDNVNEIIDKLKIMFRTKYKVHLDKIKNIFKEYLFFDLITSLNIIICENIVIVNNYGIDSYLREENNIFFLVDSISNQNNLFSNYYSKNPILILDLSYNEMIDKIIYSKLPLKVTELFDTTDEDRIFEILGEMNSDLREILLEASIEARENSIEKNIFQRQKILEYFDYAIERIDDIIISSLLYRDQNILRCFQDSLWSNCSDENIDLFKEGKRKQKETLKTNNEYFGTYNDKKFCIVKSNFSDDQRGVNKGKVCSTWKKPILIYIMINILKTPLKTEVDTSKWNAIQKISKKGREILFNEVINNKNVQVCEYNEEDKEWSMRNYEEEELEGYSDEDLEKMLFYSKITVEKLCNMIKQWFDDKNILTYDENCGTANKKS